MSLVRSSDSIPGGCAFPSSGAIRARSKTRVVDVGHRIEVAVSATPAGLLGGPECQHQVIVALPTPLAGRDVFDRSSRSVVKVGLSPISWPYDRERFTVVDYEAALAAMVACLEAGDPLIDAEVVDDLDWPTYDWHKPRHERGNMSAPAVSECFDEHPEPPTRLGRSPDAIRLQQLATPAMGDQRCPSCC